jgi:ABC-type cobalamin transport system ATPase subunit
LLLLDEPHAGLDATGRAVLDDVIKAAPGEGRTVVLASHELDRARTLAGREVALAGGRAVPLRFGVDHAPHTIAGDAETPAVELAR